MKFRRSLPSLLTLGTSASRGHSFFLRPSFFSRSPGLSNLIRQTDDLFDRLAWMNFPSAPDSRPCYHITETDDQFQIHVDVPGVQADDIHVTV